MVCDPPLVMYKTSWVGLKISPVEVVERTKEHLYIACQNAAKNTGVHIQKVRRSSDHTQFHKSHEEALQSLVRREETKVARFVQGVEDAKEDYAEAITKVRIRDAEEALRGAKAELAALKAGVNLVREKEKSSTFVGMPGNEIA